MSSISTRAVAYELGYVIKSRERRATQDNLGRIFDGAAGGCCATQRYIKSACMQATALVLVRWLAGQTTRPEFPTRVFSLTLAGWLDRVGCSRRRANYRVQRVKEQKGRRGKAERCLGSWY